MNRFQHVENLGRGPQSLDEGSPVVQARVGGRVNVVSGSRMMTPIPHQLLRFSAV